jgi:hypothetical protein
MSRLHEVRPRLHMVVVAIDSECSFEYRVLAIPLDKNPGPPDIRPLGPCIMLQPRITFEYSIF